MFDLQKLDAESIVDNRFERRLEKLSSAGQETHRIKAVVEAAMENIKLKHQSFVIYGEPQSGKTEMMIALTAKLLDEGLKIIIVLMNDSVQLLGQNLERFQRSGLSPSPKKFSEILSPDIPLGNHQWVIFCKKNSKDLKKLLDKVENNTSRVIIDDEADYATPNSKINKQEKSRINELTAKLIGKVGTYIGVTATPARLDLNNTHENLNEHWIDFPPHSYYTGQDVFFPVSVANLPYNLNFLADSGDAPLHLREALFRFMVRVGYLNCFVNEVDKNYSMLIHTSSKRADHSTDYHQVIKIFSHLKDASSQTRSSYLKSIWTTAKTIFPGHEDAITKYIIANSDRNNVVVMNSDKEVNAADNRTATDPSAPFTVAIGGNIVSRGVTFEYLLSMFFTRDVKHKLQQDTYIQRARMFGSRDSYLSYFELTIPRHLYLDWQRCFIFHRLSLDARKHNLRSPVWLDGERVSAVSSSSIDRANVVIERGEMFFDIFPLVKDQIETIVGGHEPTIQKIRAIAQIVGDQSLPAYLIRFIESFCPAGNKSIAVHMPTSIDGYSDKSGEVDKKSITRSRGFIGNPQMELTRFPDAIHHINMFFNQDGFARIFYKYRGDVRFLRLSK